LPYDALPWNTGLYQNATRGKEGVAILRDDCFSFILYTAGNLPNSVQAVSNLRAMCLAHFPNHHRIEIVDLLQNPQRGPVDGIIVTPTLVKIAPEPKQTRQTPRRSLCGWFGG
jgi:circadian clock protein KaiB